MNLPNMVTNLSFENDAVTVVANLRVSVTGLNLLAEEK